MTDCRFIAFHGWGFDDQYWKPWNDTLSDYGEFETYDRGYFKDPKEVQTLAGPVSTILITHSFGLHWIENALLNQADLLVITSGFLHFHPYAAQYRRRSRLVLQEMINALEVNPEKVLHDFYENCFAPQDAPKREVEEIDHQLLLDDLRMLHQSELEGHLLKNAEKICILHGSEDQVVPNKKGREIFTQLQDDTQYFEIKGAGHALPYTHHRRCLEFVIPEVNELAGMNS